MSSPKRFYNQSMQTEKENFSPLVNERLSFFCDRLRELRNKKGVSAREMSLCLGQNVNYINLIENGKRKPSLVQFFAICEYFSIEPKSFFCAPEPEPQSTTEFFLPSLVRELSAPQKKLLQDFVLVLRNNKF